MNERNRTWEQMGAASGLFAVLLFVVAFIIFLNTDPSGGNTPRLPNIANAQAAPAFFADHLNGIRAQVMLNSIGIVFFLWFLGTLWSTLREAEGGRPGGSAIASGGALVGVALTLVGLMLTGDLHPDYEPAPGRDRPDPLHRRRARRSPSEERRSRSSSSGLPR